MPNNYYGHRKTFATNTGPVINPKEPEPVSYTKLLIIFSIIVFAITFIIII